jgi:adenosylhomocysteine nucleosidase
VRGVLVLAALPEELAALRTAPLGPEMTLAVTGDGERNARDGAAALIAELRPASLIVVGVAGALSPGLGPGELVVARRIVREGRAACDAAPPLVAAARAAGARPAVVVSAARLADTVDEKRRLYALANADGAGEPAVVDLESAAYVEAARAAGVPWLVLRAVSDTADETLPPLLNHSLDDGGALRRGRVLVRLVGQPSALPQLLELRRRVRVCAEVLARATTVVAAALAAVG